MPVPTRIAVVLATGALLHVGACAQTPAYFGTLPPDFALPSGTTCAALVRRFGVGTAPGQPYCQSQARPDNGVIIDGANSDFNRTYAASVTGNFTGTTDEILQWGACKWGLDEDVTRARAVQESWWRQSQLGDKTDNPVPAP